MTAASHSLATALWKARFASGLLMKCYTTSWDTIIGIIGFDEAGLPLLALRCGRRSGFAHIRAALKVGTNSAIDLLAARRRGDRPLSTPQAAGGGGQRPAFTGVYRAAGIIRRDWCMVALGTLLS